FLGIWHPVRQGFSSAASPVLLGEFRGLLTSRHSEFREYQMLQAMKNRLPFTLTSGKTCISRILFPFIFIHLLCVNPLSAQDQKEESGVAVSGTVTDENGQPLLGVNILIEGTDTGTVTDEDGRYSIAVSPGRVLVFSFLGFQSQTITVGETKTVDVKLKEEVSALDEVVVIGYGTQRRSDLTGSVSQVGSREINEFPSTNVLQSLSGRAAGVQVSPTTGAPGAGLNVRIRGTNSIQGSNEPLYVVDGFPIFGSNPTILNNTDIESIEVLKDAS